MLVNKVMVLMGGTSAEREVSLRSGAAVLSALKRKGYEVKGIDICSDSLREILEYKPDVVFLALHGKNGEDGNIQGMLEVLQIPYTGSGVTSSAICINKVLSKKLLSYENIPTADFIAINKKDFLEEHLLAIIEEIGIPMVVKAATQGSSIGVSIVKEKDAVLSAIRHAFEYDQEILIEKFIPGVEVTAAVIGNDDLEVLPIIEITSENEFFDYESKYTPGKCEHIIPARIEPLLKKQVEELSIKAYKSMGCRGFARIDFIIADNGQAYALELNTIPGLTEMSLVPDAGRAAGISFEDLIEKIILLALEK